MKILITAGATSQAQKLRRLLDKGEEFMFADQVELPAFMNRDSRFVLIPSGDAFSFAHNILALCLDLGIDYVYPLRKLEIVALSEARQLFEEYSIKVVVPRKEVVEELLQKPAIKGEVLILCNKEEIFGNPDSSFPVDSVETGTFNISTINGETSFSIYNAD